MTTGWPASTWWIMIEKQVIAAGLKGILSTKPTTRGRKTTIMNEEISGDRITAGSDLESKWSDQVPLTKEQ